MSTLDRPKIFLSDCYNTTRVTFPRQRQIVRGRLSRNRRSRRAPRLAGFNTNSKNRGADENNGFVIIQSRSRWFERATRRRAEGFERTHLPEKLQFYNVARGSTAEVRSLLYVLEDNFPQDAAQAVQIRDEVVSAGRLISGLIRSTEERKTTRSGHAR
ncbi:MAG: rRNA-intervening sequence protein [Verrucomicrobiota bacterium]